MGIFKVGSEDNGCIGLGPFPPLIPKSVIPREERSKIFEPFFTTKQDDGTGPGLWITKQLTENYGGRIRVRSSEVEGHRAVRRLVCSFRGM